MGTGQQTALPIPAITIDVTQDLESTSDLKALISANGNVLLQLGSALAHYAGKPVSSAIGQSSPTLTLTAAPKWTAGPVTFSLTPTAKCSIAIAAKGEAFKVATKIDDPADTTDVQLPAAGMTYINIDIDFDLTGDVSGNGTAWGLAISGKASGSTTTTLSYCQPVNSNTETVAALKKALSRFVFPTSPGGVSRMDSGSSCRITFDGALSWELDLTYGLADHKLSAPSAALVQASVDQLAQQKLTLPAANIKAGATATMKYSHTDHFGLVVTKQDANTAFLYLVRAAADETDAGIGISAGITTTPRSVTVDPSKVQAAIQSVTGSAALATSVLNTVTPQVNNLESAALAKLNNAIKAANGDAGISLALSKQTARTVLFNYQLDLAMPLAVQSWDDLFKSSIADARNIAGFTLLAGSGVEQELAKSATLQLHFFNLYQYSSVQKFFDKCYSELAPDGTIRIVFDIGISAVVKQNQSVDTVRFHFSATASETVLANVTAPEIDLMIEISEKSDPKDAAVLANILGIVNQASLGPAIAAMNAWVASHPSGTLGMVAVLKRSAYGRLAFSPYLHGKSQQDQSLDAANWTAIHLAAVQLMGKNLPFLGPFSWSDWQTWNVYCINGQPGVLADRRHSGPYTAVPPSLWKGYPAPSVDYFFRACAGGMNLFEDSVTLATASVTTDAQWQSIKAYVIKIVQGDANIDYSKPIAAAILSQAAAHGSAQMAVSTAQSPDASSFTTTLTIS